MQTRICLHCEWQEYLSNQIFAHRTTRHTQKERLIDFDEIKSTKIWPNWACNSLLFAKFIDIIYICIQNLAQSVSSSFSVEFSSMLYTDEHKISLSITKFSFSLLFCVKRQQQLKWLTICFPRTITWNYSIFICNFSHYIVILSIFSFTDEIQ